MLIIALHASMDHSNMAKTFQNIKIGLDEDLENSLHLLCPGWTSYRILRQSVDARTRHFPHFVMTLEV